MKDNCKAVSEYIKRASKIVVLQADNPDGDSLSSALALEQILSDLGKEPHLYCGVDMPTYLRYLPGWDRVDKELPKRFDLSVIVDTSAIELFGNLKKSGQLSHLKSQPCIVLDHHAVENTIAFAAVVYNEQVVATGELIYELAKILGWPLNGVAKDMLATSIMSDSLGLSSPSTSARSVHIIGELVEAGVNIAALNDASRLLMRKSPKLLYYKGELLQRVEYFADDRIAIVVIPWEEIVEYSPLYNPTMLVIDELRNVENVEVAIGFKIYDDGKITAKIRCNHGYPIANKLAEHFGGGGHDYASGFKITDGRHFDQLKSECVELATDLLDAFNKESRI
jgi:bifunctional oligoribonuclease and PAP phosphatase NrnA